MGNTLELPCEACDRPTPHPVVRTDPEIFYWSEDHRRYFYLMFGIEPLFRQRERRCSECGAQCLTVETQEDVLAGLIAEVDRLNEMLHGRSRSSHLSSIRYFPGVVQFIGEVFGESPDRHADPRLTWQEAGEVLGDVSDFLEAIEPDLAAWVRLRYHLWDAPEASEAERPLNPMNRLRHPSKSAALRDVHALLFERH